MVTLNTLTHFLEKRTQLYGLWQQFFSAPALGMDPAYGETEIPPNTIMTHQLRVTARDDSPMKATQAYTFLWLPATWGQSWAFGPSKVGQTTLHPPAPLKVTVCPLTSEMSWRNYSETQWSFLHTNTTTLVAAAYLICSTVSYFPFAVLQSKVLNPQSHIQRIERNRKRE